MIICGDYLNVYISYSIEIGTMVYYAIVSGTVVGN